MAISGMAIGALTMHPGRVIAMMRFYFPGALSLPQAPHWGWQNHGSLAFFRYKELKRCSQACPDLREFDRTLHRPARLMTVSLPCGWKEAEFVYRPARDQPVAPA